MRGFSVKAFIAGNLLFFVLAGVVGCLLIFTMMLFASFGDPNGASVHDIALALMSSEVSVSIVLTASIVSAAVASGYAAGRIAANGSALNGALATVVWTLINVSESIGDRIVGSSEPAVAVPTIMQFVLLFGCPIFSALGAYLAKGRGPLRRGVRSANRTAGPIVDAGVTFARCMLALLIAAAAYATCVELAEGLAIGGAGGILIVLGTVLAITLGTSVVPQHLRKLTGYFLIALVLLASAEEFARNAVAGVLSQFPFFVQFLNIFGAIVSYLALMWAFPRTFEPAARWWWLSGSRYASWSVEERRARNALFMTGAVSWVVVYSLMVFALGWIGVEAHTGAVSAALLTLPFALFAARPIYALIEPLTLRRADENAAARRGTAIAGR